MVWLLVLWMSLCCFGRVTASIQPCISDTRVSAEVYDIFYLLQPLPTLATPCVTLQLLRHCPAEALLLTLRTREGDILERISFASYQSGDWNQWIACVPATREIVATMVLEADCETVPNQLVAIAWGTNGTATTPLATYTRSGWDLRMQIFHTPAWIVYPSSVWGTTGWPPERIIVPGTLVVRSLPGLSPVNTSVVIVTDTGETLSIAIPPLLPPLPPPSPPSTPPTETTSPTASIPWLDYDGDQMWIAVGALGHLLHAVGCVRLVWVRHPLLAVAASAVWSSILIPYTVVLRRPASYMWSLLGALVGLAVYITVEGIAHFVTHGQAYMPLPSKDKLLAIKMAVTYLGLNVALSLLAVSTILPLVADASD